MQFQPTVIGEGSRGPDDPGREDLLRCSLEQERDGENFLEYHARVTNAATFPVWLERVHLAEIRDFGALGLEERPFLVFRSGRHKNDLPGLFETACPDERLQDVSSVMAESGGGMEASDGSRQVISDHLTLIRDRAGNCLAAEFLTGRDQLFQSVLTLDEKGNLERLSCETVFQRWLDPGESVRTETLRLAMTADPEAEVEEFARRKAELSDCRNRRHPAVFCTWYYYGLSVTWEDVRTNLRLIREKALPYEVFQVDEGWEMTLGEYEPNEKFPVSMREMAEEIRKCGLEPGLWSSPFVAHETASVWKAHPEWILRKRTGEPCLFPMNDTVYYVFDITNPATWDYFREMYRRFTFEWGYTYHKLDFTRAAVIYEKAAFHDQRITLAQAYYQAVRAIREGMGEDAFFLMCGGLYDPIIGLVDAQRTGSDVLSMWSSTVNRDGKTAPYTIRQSLFRYYMNRWWANDPDALMIRRNPVMERGSRLTYGLLTEEEVKTSVINQFAGGGIFCQTEPLDRIDEDRLRELRHLLPMPEREVQPLSLMSGARFPEGADVFLPRTGAHCVCLINWSDTEEKPAEVQLEKLPLDPEARYTVCDFYAKEYRTDVGPWETVSLSALKPHEATVVKVEKQSGQPIVVRSDGHYAMGAELKMEIAEGVLRVETAASPVWETAYTILLPKEYLAQGKNTVQVTLSPDRPRAEVRLSALPA